MSSIGRMNDLVGTNCPPSKRAVRKSSKFKLKFVNLNLC